MIDPETAATPDPRYDRDGAPWTNDEHPDSGGLPVQPVEDRPGVSEVSPDDYPAPATILPPD